MTRIAENRHLGDVFEALFAAHGPGLHLAPATHFVRHGRAVTFATVVKSGRRRGQNVIGYRLLEETARSVPSAACGSTRQARPRVLRDRVLGHRAGSGTRAPRRPARPGAAR